MTQFEFDNGLLGIATFCFPSLCPIWLACPPLRTRTQSSTLSNQMLLVVCIIAIFCCLSHFGVYWTSHPFGETGLLPRCICPHDHHSSRRTGYCSRWFDVLECLGTQATRSQGVAATR